MKKLVHGLFTGLLLCSVSVFSAAALEPAADPPADAAVPAAESTTVETPEAAVSDKAADLVEKTQAKVEELAEKVDQNVTAKEAAEGLLGKIYLLAEKISFPAFHWVAFGLKSAGVVSFALQLVLGKLMVLFRGSINLREILSDVFGLVISAVGLVLTTQAAAENSTFTHSAAGVLSSAGAGVILGFMLYRWGQAIEVNAVAGQRAQSKNVAAKS